MRVPQQLHRPTIILDTDKFEPGDGMCYPQTPPLSTAGSVISSPGSCDMLATPLNPMFSGLEGTPMFKEEVEAQPIEQFPNLEWHSCASPPMTPSKSTNISFLVVASSTKQACMHACMRKHGASKSPSLVGEAGTVSYGCAIFTMAPLISRAFNRFGWPQGGGGLSRRCKWHDFGESNHPQKALEVTRLLGAPGRDVGAISQAACADLGACLQR